MLERAGREPRQQHGEVQPSRQAPSGWTWCRPGRAVRPRAGHRAGGPAVTCSSASTALPRLVPGPGSGLGLAIVEQIVARHGEPLVGFEPAPRGAVVGFQLPVTATSALPSDVIDRSVTFAPTITRRDPSRAGAASSMEEHRTFNPLVLGSSPRRPTEADQGGRISGRPALVASVPSPCLNASEMASAQASWSR